MQRYLNLKISDYIHTSEKKKYFNQKMFSVIAPRYDFITRLFSFGQDATWKRELVDRLPDFESPTCLDLACGTGDIACLLAEKYPKAQITGLDLTDEMLDLARRRNHYLNVQFIKGDMGKLEQEPNSIDLITGGYALRNAPDLHQLITEICRVLRPGGVATFLDFSKPSNQQAQKFQYYALKYWTGLWGIVLHGNHEVYSYIAESLRLFPDRQELEKLFKSYDFTVLNSQLYFLGITQTLMLQKK